MFALILVIAAGIFLSIIYSITYLITRRFIYTKQPSDHFRYCLVLGAGLEKDGKPSDILMDRISTAVNLYENKRIDYLIMSGSRRRGYDEPNAMKVTALASGIPESAILIDPGGVSTLNSCFNVRENYAPDYLLIVTQQFHLPRAILLQRALGVNASGIAARLYKFSWYKKAFWYLREMLSLPYNMFKLLFYLH